MDDESTLIPLSAPDPTGFDVVLRGYDRAQVDHHVNALEQLVAQAERECEDLRARLAEAQDAAADAGPPTWERLGGHVSRILALAEEQAAAIREAARRDLEAARTELARQRALGEEARREIMLDAERTTSQLHLRAQERAEAMLQEAQREADRMIATGRAEAERLARERDAIRAELEALHERIALLTGEPHGQPA